MKYIITNSSVISSDRERTLFEAQVDRLAGKLEIIPEHYLGRENLKINIVKINNFEFRISCSVKLKTSLVYLSDTGKDIIGTSTSLFDKFRKQVAIELEKNRLWYAKNKKINRVESVENYLEDLEQFKDAKDESSFKSLVMMLLPGLERYVERMLKSAQMADLLTKGDVTPDDIIDEIILRIFETFEENKEKAEDMNIWMMRETDNVLNELIDDSKHSKHAASVEDLANSELSALEEKYMLDSSGDPIMLEELDDYEHPESLLGIEEALLVSGSEKETVDRISDNLSRKQMKEMIRNEMVNLPLRHQAVYDLFFFEQTDIEEIAQIKNESPERVEEIIEEVKHYLKQRLSL